MAGSRRLEVLAARVRDMAPVVPDGPVAVALSGGADSAVAAWLMIDRGHSCRAVHIDHGLPGSPVMLEAAHKVAGGLGIDLDVRTVEVPSGPSPEDQARTVRYRALGEALVEGEWLVTGHTRDDQAETVLLNLLRGAGLDGLAGIPRRRGFILRPLLDVTRSETRELAALLQLPWRDDPANTDPDIRRNQVRRSLIPDLEARFNPQLRATLAALADLAAEAGRASRREQRIQVREVEGGLALPAPELHAAGEERAKRALRRALRRLRGPHAGERDEIERLLTVAEGAVAATQLAGNLRAYRRGPWLVLSAGGEAGAPSEVLWPVPGVIRFGPWSMEAWIDERPPVAFPLSSWTAVADRDLLPEALMVRAATKADALDGVPVPELLRKLGIPADRRPGWPVVVSERGVVWVPGSRISRAVWVGSTTGRYLWVHAGLETV